MVTLLLGKPIGRNALKMSEFARIIKNLKKKNTCMLRFIRYLQNDKICNKIISIQ